MQTYRLRLNSVLTKARVWVRPGEVYRGERIPKRGVVRLLRGFDNADSYDAPAVNVQRVESDVLRFYDRESELDVWVSLLRPVAPEAGGRLEAYWTASFQVEDRSPDYLRDAHGRDVMFMDEESAYAFGFSAALRKVKEILRPKPPDPS